MSVLYTNMVTTKELANYELIIELIEERKRELEWTVRVGIKDGAYSQLMRKQIKDLEGLLK